MGFRPFVRLFLDRTFESYVETTHSALSGKKRSQSQKIPRKDFPLQTSGRCVGLWNAQLAEMQQRVGQQRLQIKYTRSTGRGAGDSEACARATWSGLEAEKPPNCPAVPIHPERQASPQHSGPTALQS